MARESSWRRWLGAGLALLACTGPGQGSTASGASTAVEGSGTSTGSTGSGPEPSSTSAAEPTAGSSSSLDTGQSSDTTASTGTSSTSSAESTTTGPGLAPCEAGCEVEVMCTDAWPSVAECVDACEANLVEAARFERACAAAWEDLHACLGTLTCEQLAEWMRPVRFPYPCLSEDEVLMFECAGQ